MSGGGFRERGEPRYMPHNAEAEAALLGAILVSNSAYFHVSRDLRADHFYEPVHGRIYAALGELITNRGEASPLTLKQYFDADEALEKVGGGSYLYDLAANVITVVNAEEYGRVIIDLWQRREQITVLEEAADMLEAPELEAPASEIGSTLISRVGKVLEAGSATAKTRRDVLNDVLEGLRRPVRADSSGLWELDERTVGGFHAGRAYCIAGRKKQGKSTLGGTISTNLNNAGVPHLVVVLEMGPNEYEMRAIGRECGFNSMRFLEEKSREDISFLNEVGNYTATATDSTYYLDRPGLTLDELRAQAVYHKQKYKIRGIIIDYVQLLSGRKKGQTTAEFMDEVATWIAQAVKRLDIWILALAQLNQEGNIRGGEGVRLAFDQVYGLHPAETVGRAYLEMMDSRYTPHGDIGTKYDGALELKLEGPHFAEVKPNPALEPELGYNAEDL